MKTIRSLPLCLLCLVIVPFFSSCSINRMAVRAVGKVLSSTGGGSLFTGDEDPELIGDALPLALKLYEGLLSQDPENMDLLLTAGIGFISYGNAFVQTPASMLTDTAYLEQKAMYARAKKLYLRGRNYILAGLESRHPGFRLLLEEGNIDAALAMAAKEDASFLYWGAAGWLSAIALDLFDFELTMDAYKAVALAARALELDESFGQGSLHELFISVYGGVPEHMLYRPFVPGAPDPVKDALENFYRVNAPGAKTLRERAVYHYDRAVQLSGGMKASPHLSYASAFARKNETPEEYVALLEKALAVDIDASPENRLMNIISQRKAEWQLTHLEDIFPFAEEVGEE